MEKWHYNNMSKVGCMGLQTITKVAASSYITDTTVKPNIVVFMRLAAANRTVLAFSD